MSNLSRMVNVASGVGKDRLNILRTKGVDTVMSNARIVNGVADAADSIIEVGSDASSLGLGWCLNLDVMPLYEEVLKEVGLDNRMFVRKAERGGFENVHKLFTKLAGTRYWPDMNGKILLLEALGGESGQIGTLFNQLDDIGVFDQISGVLLGTFTNYEKAGPSLTVYDLLKMHISEVLPVACTRDIGHGHDAKAIMIGKEYSIHADTHTSVM